MSFLGDLFGGGASQDISNATNDQVSGLVNGANAAMSYLNKNPSIITSYGGQALQPYSQNYSTATAGLGALGNLLGLNGPTGTQSALTQLQTTPGYQFTLGQGDKAINAAAAANGTLNSGNQLTALSNYNTGLAQNTYSNAVNQYSPYFGLGTNSAGGIAGVNMGEASGLTGNNNQLAQLLDSMYTGIGNAQASGQLAQAAQSQSSLGGLLSLGSSLLGSFGGFGGIGNALSGLFGGGGGDTISAGLDGLDFLGGL